MEFGELSIAAPLIKFQHHLYCSLRLLCITEWYQSIQII